MIAQRITDYIEAADHGFKRDTSPDIYQAYCEYVSTGQYPYLTSVMKYIVDKFALNVDMRKLEHEVYLASGMFAKEKQRKRGEELLSDGYYPAREDVAEDGKHYMLVLKSGKTVKVRCRVDDVNGVFFFPPRHSRTGYSLQNDMWLKEVAS